MGGRSARGATSRLRIGGRLRPRPRDPRAGPPGDRRPCHGDRPLRGDDSPGHLAQSWRCQARPGRVASRIGRRPRRVQRHLQQGAVRQQLRDVARPPRRGSRSSSGRCARVVARRSSRSRALPVPPPRQPTASVERRPNDSKKRASPTSGGRHSPCGLRWCACWPKPLRNEAVRPLRATALQMRPPAPRRDSAAPWPRPRWLIALAPALLALAAAARLATLDDADPSTDLLSDLGTWAWAAGIALIVADLVLPVPQASVITALGAIYGLALGTLLGTAGLILAGVCGYAP